MIPAITNKVKQVKKARKTAVRLICSKAGIKKLAWKEFEIPRVATDVVNKIAKDEQDIIREEIRRGSNAMPPRRQTLMMRDIWANLGRQLAPRKKRGKKIKKIKKG